MKRWHNETRRLPSPAWHSEAGDNGGADDIIMGDDSLIMPARENSSVGERILPVHRHTAE